MRNWFQRATALLISAMMLVLLCTSVLAVGSNCEDVPADKYDTEYLYKLAETCTQLDVEVGQSYSDEVVWAQENGIVTGYYDGNLGAIDTMTIAHTCVPATEWSKNETYHWHTCTDNDCTLELDKAEHDWNNGELKTADAVTYTCKVEGCCITKQEPVTSGTKITTRADLENAIVATAWSYYMKGIKLQYDSVELTPIAYYRGGINRLTPGATPEYGTSDTTIFAVCSDYVYKTYLEALGVKVLGDPNTPAGHSTAMLARMAENQQQSTYQEVAANGESFTDQDVDTAIVRWIDFVNYSQGTSNYITRDNLYKVYESTAFTDFVKDSDSTEDDNLEFKPTGDKLTNQGVPVDEYAYYLNGNEIDASTVWTYVKNYLTENNCENLRPGDLYVDATHAMLYVGNGMILHCSGSKYKPSNNTDSFDANGDIEYSTLSSRLSNSTTDVIVMRPLEFYATDYDGDPGNDVVSIEVPEDTQSRIDYPAMEIDRTVDITTFGTVTNGENLTYSIKISNKSNNTNYTSWGGTPVPYHGLLVTETIPGGTTFVSASEGYSLEDGVITWNLADIAAGSSVTLSYTVKVTAAVGSTITNDGGYVADIPSNSISNTVGGAKMDDITQEYLASLNDGATWKSGADLDFAEGIYAKLGTTLDLPNINDTVGKLFSIKKEHIAQPCSELFSVDSVARDMFVLKNPVADADQTLAAMLVDKYYGGYRFYVGDENQYKLNNSILEFKVEYLEPGDIIVYAQLENRVTTGVAMVFSPFTVMVYDGENLLAAATTSSGETTYTVYSPEDTGTNNQHLNAVEEQLLKALQNTNDLFFVLRPSQVNDGVTMHNWTQVTQTCTTTVYACSCGVTSCPEAITVLRGHGNHDCDDWRPLEGTETHIRTCTVCETYTESQTHAWANGETAGTQKCDVCGATRMLEPKTVAFTVPEGATVTVKATNGTEFIDAVDGQDNVYSLLPDTYVYTVSKEGYLPETDEFTVNTDSITISVSLEADPLYQYFLTNGFTEAALGGGYSAIGNYGLVLCRENVGTETEPVWQVTFATTSGVKVCTIDYEYLGKTGTEPEVNRSPNGGQISLIGETDEITGRTKIYEFPRVVGSGSKITYNGDAKTKLISARKSRLVGTLSSFTIKNDAQTKSYPKTTSCPVLVCDETGTIRRATADDIQTGGRITGIRDGSQTNQPFTFVIAINNTTLYEE